MEYAYDLIFLFLFDLNASTTFFMMLSLIRSKISWRPVKSVPISMRRQSTRVLHNPDFQKKAIVNGILIANGVVFLGWYKSDRDYKLRQFMFKHFTISNDGIFKHLRLHTIITSFFSHRDGMHILFNGLCFYSFAQTAMAMLSPAQFLMLYIGSGVVGNLAFLCPWSKIIPKSLQSFQSRYSNKWHGDLFSTNRVGLGASGAVNGLIMWTVCTFPTSMFYIYGVLPVPAIVAGAGIYCYEIYEVYTESGNQLVAHDAHIAGALFGLAYFIFQSTKRYTRRILM